MLLLFYIYWVQWQTKEYIYIYYIFYIESGGANKTDHDLILQIIN